jgi:hypothetical protein
MADRLDVADSEAYDLARDAALAFDGEGIALDRDPAAYAARHQLARLLHVEKVVTDAGLDISDPEVEQGIEDGIESAVEMSVASAEVACYGGGGSEDLDLAAAYPRARAEARDRGQGRPGGLQRDLARLRVSHRPCHGRHRRASRGRATRHRGSRRRASTSASSSSEPHEPSDIDALAPAGGRSA